MRPPMFKGPSGAISVLLCFCYNRAMRLWFYGPRIAGIRTGVSIGPEDWRAMSRSRSNESTIDPDHSFVYVVRDDARGLCKIGQTTNPAARLAQLRSDPSPIKGPPGKNRASLAMSAGAEAVDTPNVPGPVEFDLGPRRSGSNQQAACRHTASRRRPATGRRAWPLPAWRRHGSPSRPCFRPGLAAPRDRSRRSFACQSIGSGCWWVSGDTASDTGSLQNFREQHRHSLRLPLVPSGD